MTDNKQPQALLPLDIGRSGREWAVDIEGNYWIKSQWGKWDLLPTFSTRRGSEYEKFIARHQLHGRPR